MSEEILVAHKEPSHKWTKEAIVELASNYERLSEFVADHPRAYYAAMRNGWKDAIADLRRRYDPRDREARRAELRKLVEQYEYRVDLMHEHQKEWDEILNRGWKDLLAGLKHKVQRWDKEKVAEIAKRYTTLLDFRTENPAAYSAAFRRGWSDVLEHLQVTTPGKFSEAELLAKAKEYPTRASFAEAEPEAYRAAVRYTEIRKHWKQIEEPKNRWTRERIADLVSEHQTLKEFRTAHPLAYRAAWARGWGDLLEPLERDAKAPKTKQ